MPSESQPPKTLDALRMSQAKTVDEYLDSITIAKLQHLVNLSAVLLVVRQNMARENREADKIESDRRRTEVASTIASLVRNAPPTLRLEVANRLERDVRQQWHESVERTAQCERMDLATIQPMTDNGLGKIFAMTWAMQAEENVELRAALAEARRVEALRGDVRHEFINGAGI